MIFNINDIKTYNTTEQLGDMLIKQTYKLHKPTGVFFSSNSNNETNEFLYFVVAVINENKDTEERKTFDGTTQQSFFEAVEYFERLIEDRIPQPKEEEPSVGKFYFVKGQNSFVILDFGDKKPIIIEREDLEKVFSPPRKKPFGRLNMLEVDKPQYDPIKGKFALKYNEDSTLEFLEKMQLNEGDAVVYNMTPYSSEPQTGQNPPQEPQNVNDEELSLDKIEDENPEDLKGENEDNEPKNGDDEGDDDREGDDDFENPNDDKGDKKRKNKDQKAKPSKDGEPDDDGEPSDEEGDDDEGDDEGDDKRHIFLGRQPQPQDIINQISDTLGVEDAVYAYRKQKNMITALKGINETKLKETLYEALGVNPSLSKAEFLEMVKTNTNEFFE